MLRKELLRENKVLVWENKLVLREKSAKENVVLRENLVALSAASYGCCPYMSQTYFTSKGFSSNENIRCINTADCFAHCHGAVTWKTTLYTGEL